MGQNFVRGPGHSLGNSCSFGYSICQSWKRSYTMPDFLTASVLNNPCIAFRLVARPARQHHVSDVPHCSALAYGLDMVYGQGVPPVVIVVAVPALRPVLPPEPPLEPYAVRHAKFGTRGPR